MNNGIMDSKVMGVFMYKMEDEIGKALTIANEQDKEVELIFKMNIGILAKWKEQGESEAGVTPMIQPEMDFKITRKVKETKVASEGIITDAELKFDEEGKPYLVSTNSQMDMDDYTEQQENEEPEPLINDEDIIDAEYTEVDQKVIAFERDEEQMIEDSKVIDDTEYIPEYDPEDDVQDPEQDYESEHYTEEYDNAIEKDAEELENQFFKGTEATDNE